MADEIDTLDDTPVSAKPTIEGTSAAAILLMLLDESEAATILKHLDADEVRGGHIGHAVIGHDHQVDDVLELVTVHDLDQASDRAIGDRQRPVDLG